MPHLTLFAGPNGSGKSSIIKLLDFAGRENLLEADAISKRINPSNPRRAAVAAAREVLRRTRLYLDENENFAIETTLSGSWTIGAIKAARAKAYLVRLVYISIDNPERSIQRVHERVAQGGHDVPDEDVRRRYSRSLSNLSRVIPMVNQAILYDNSSTEPRLVMEFVDGILTERNRDLPFWARTLLRSLQER